jgi:hypothetical protein
MTDSNKINEHNFEKFYQDFTHGRLDEKRCEELFSFMEVHADWLEEDSSAVVLSPLDNESLNNDFKQSLLQVNFEQEAIVPSNINAFLNAKIEGLLSEEAEFKLNVFLDENPQFQSELKWLAKVHLEADYKLKYPNKSDLKRKETRLLWPIIAAAACLACLLMFNWNRNTEKIQSATQNAATEKQLAPLNAEASIQEKDEVSTENNWVDGLSKDYTYTVSQTMPWDTLNYTNVFDAHIAIDTADFLEEKAPVMNPEIFKLPKETVISLNDYVQEAPVHKVNQLALNNPIHPITTGLSYLTQQEIDFRMQNDASNKKGRYFLKVGKLEILHIEN